MFYDPRSEPHGLPHNPWNALISPRPYKRAWSAMEAIDYVREQSGRMLDPDCVEALLQNLPRLYEICDRYSTGAVKAAQE